MPPVREDQVQPFYPCSFDLPSSTKPVQYKILFSPRRTWLGRADDGLQTPPTGKPLVPVVATGVPVVATGVAVGVAGAPVELPGVGVGAASVGIGVLPVT